VASAYRSAAVTQGQQLARRDLRLLIGAVVAGVVVWLPGAPVRAQSFSYPKRITIFFFAIGLVLSQAHRGRELQTSSKSIEWTAAFLLLVWVVSPVDLMSIERLAIWSASVASCALLFDTARRSRHAEGTSTNFVFWCCLVVSLLLATCVLEATGAIPQISESGRRPGGVFGNRNTAARFACLALPLAWLAVARVGARSLRIAGAVCVSLAGFVIVVSRARSAWLGACVVLSVLVVLSIVYARCVLPRVAVFGATFLAGGVFALVVPNRLSWTLHEYSASAATILEWRSGSGLGRTVQLRTTLRSLENGGVLGAGVGSWPREYLKVASEDDPTVQRDQLRPIDVAPHAEMVAVIGELGAAGVAIVLLLLALVQREGWRRLRSTERTDRCEGMAFCATGAAVGLFGLLEPIVWSPTTLVIISLSLGVTSTISSLSQRESMVGIRYGLRQAAHLWLGALLAFGLWCSASGLAGTVVLRDARQLSDLRRAVRVAPLSLEAQHALAFVLISARRCDLARHALVAATALAPYSVPVQQLAVECR
jgi:O-antigen ligase